MRPVSRRVQSVTVGPPEGRFGEIVAGLVSALAFPVIASGLLRQASSDSSRLPIDTAASTA